MPISPNASAPAVPSIKAGGSGTIILNSNNVGSLNSIGSFNSYWGQNEGWIPGEDGSEAYPLKPANWLFDPFSSSPIGTARDALGWLITKDGQPVASFSGQTPAVPGLVSGNRNNTNGWMLVTQWNYTGNPYGPPCSRLVSGVNVTVIVPPNAVPGNYQVQFDESFSPPSNSYEPPVPNLPNPLLYGERICTANFSVNDVVRSKPSPTNLSASNQTNPYRYVLRNVLNWTPAPDTVLTKIQRASSLNDWIDVQQPTAYFYNFVVGGTSAGRNALMNYDSMNNFPAGFVSPADVIGSNDAPFVSSYSSSKGLLSYLIDGSNYQYRLLEKYNFGNNDYTVPGSSASLTTPKYPTVVTAYFQTTPPVTTFLSEIQRGVVQPSIMPTPPPSLGFPTGVYVGDSTSWDIVGVDGSILATSANPQGFAVSYAVSHGSYYDICSNTTMPTTDGGLSVSYLYPGYFIPNIAGIIHGYVVRYAHYSWSGKSFPTQMEYFSAPFDLSF